MGTAENVSMPQPALPGESAVQPEPHGHVNRTDVVIFALVGVAAAVSWLGFLPRVAGIDLLAVAAVLGGGWPVFREALQNLLARRMTMELSMTLALGAALGMREFSTAVFILFFVLGAEILEDRTVTRGRRAIRDLLALLPAKAVVRFGNELVDVPISEVHPGDIVVIRPAAEIPVDGVVVAGRSTVNQANITGESMPVDKLPGAPVFAGATNHTGMLEVRTECVGLDTAFGRIVDAVEKAERCRAPVQKLADRLAGWIVYFALASAILTVLLTHNIRSALAVVIAAGACGVAAGTPLALLGAIGRAARGGAVVKGGRHMEALGAIDTVVLDKTGTLTFGEPFVTAVIPYPAEDGDRVVRLAAIAERPSEHPVGKAIQKEAARWGVIVSDPQSFEYLPGRGVRASWNGGEILVGSATWLSEDSGLSTPLRRMPEAAGDVLVAYRGKLMGALRIEDALRPEAAEAVSRMKALGLNVVLLTGDRARVAEKVAHQLGVQDFAADLLPHHKLERVEQLIRSGRRVAMVGDGINDAPALAQATVGIAMGSGTDLARQSAGVLLLGNNLLDCVDLLETARRCRRIIFFNFAGTLAADLAGVALAAVGILTPLLAAVLHVTSEMAFILNSARLVPGGEPPK
ncbi:MAG TPA: cation-translocating P-type ATPase [Bryobacteraceae bacterium]|nr:cation-translocating P-type ATPase [Bryobacteraceae bacterium]